MSVVKDNVSGPDQRLASLVMRAGRPNVLWFRTPHTLEYLFLANVNVVARPSVVCRLSSVCNSRGRAKAVEILGIISTEFGTLSNR